MFQFFVLFLPPVCMDGGGGEKGAQLLLQTQCPGQETIRDSDVVKNVPGCCLSGLDGSVLLLA